MTRIAIAAALVVISAGMTACKDKKRDAAVPAPAAVVLLHTRYLENR